MKLFKNILNSVKPHFTEGGKLEKLYPAYDAFETFLFVPDHTSQSGTHIHDAIDLKRTMFSVIIALIPCLLFGMWNIGYQHFIALGQTHPDWLDAFIYGAWRVLPMVIVSYGVGLGIEFAFAISRGHSVNEGYLVTGLLIPMIMPADLPLWMLATAVAFAVVIGKEVFGGTGMNILNPALTARAFLYFAYPTELSGDKVWVSLGFLFGVVFMATDPVSASQTTKGKWIYGFLVGLLGILIRVVNPAYPEGIMMAILFMNVMAPLIDHYVVSANINRRMKRLKTT